LIIPESILIQGFISGVTYALLACGFTLVYGVTRILNLAHGAFYMLGAYVFYVLTFGYMNLHPAIALIVAPVIVGFLGVVCYILILRPIVNDYFGIMVVTVALALIIQQLTLIIFGPQLISIASIVTGSIVIGRTGLTYSRILALIISIIVFIGLWLFTVKSKTGTALRALSQDVETAKLMGINVKKIYALTMFLSVAFAALAGILIVASVTRQLTPSIWLAPLTVSFSIVVIGGLGSVKGSFLGGIILGYIENIVVSLVPGGGYLIDLIAMSMVMLILLVKPAGLFGKYVERA
jgi:branched-chain amino acid transport system permease protein